MSILLIINKSERVTPGPPFRGNFDHRSLLMTTQALIFHIPGLLFIGWNRILLAGFYAGKNFKIPVLIAAVVMVINLICALWFAKIYGHSGIALANTISQIAQTLFLFYFITSMLQYRLLNLEIFQSLAKNCFSSGMMLLILWSLKEKLLGWNLNISITYLLLVLIGGSTFLLSSIFLKTKEMTEILNVFRKRE